MPRAKKKIDILLHELVPQHVILSKKETEKMLKKYMVDLWQLPRIADTDPAVLAIGAHRGDVVKIIRKSETTVDKVYVYRLVVKNK
ncbi:MAG: DNA-directed RNA polymerase subunit H [Promethearchaeota archaeon]